MTKNVSKAFLAAGQLYQQKIAEQSRKKFIDFLESKGEVCLYSEAKNIVSGSVLNRLLKEHREEIQVFRLYWVGGARGKILSGGRFIKTEYLGKHIIAITKNRSSIVRFFMKIFKAKPEGKDKYDRRDIKAITQWLKRFGLTRAERTAIITKLGYKYYHHSKNLTHMRIDGYLDRKPKGKSSKKQGLNQKGPFLLA